MSRIAPIALATIDHRGKKQNASVVRQTASGLGQLRERCSVLARAPIVKDCANEMDFRAVWLQARGCVDFLLRQTKMIDSLVGIHPIQIKMILRERTDGR